MRKYLWLVLVLICMSVSLATAELPPPIKGENFQRVTKLIDCQQYRIAAMSGAHTEIKFTTCYYEAVYYENGKEIPIIISINHNFNTKSNESINIISVIP